MGDFQFKLTVFTPNGEQTDFDLTSPKVSMGRLIDANEIVLQDDRASRKHALMERKGSSYVITDQNSSNGTIVNGAIYKGDGVLLRNGDEIIIGNHRMVYNILTVDDVPLGGIEYARSATDLLKSAVQLTAPNATTNLKNFLQDVAKSAPAEQKSAVEMDLLIRRSRVLGVIYELNRSLSKAFNAASIYEKVAKQIYEGSNGGRVVFAFAKEKEDAIEVKWQNFKGELEKQDLHDLPVSRSILKKAMQEKVSILFDPLSNKNMLSQHTMQLQGGRIRSVICAPLLVQDDVAIGAIYVDCNKIFGFTDEDLDFLAAVAASAATAIDKINAHDRLLKDAEARATYRRFLPGFVVDQIMSNPQGISMGGVSQRVTIFFADIRGFTTLSERKTPAEIVGLLNIYFERAATEIFRNNGTLDKFIGDGIMALFGAPKTSPEDSINAIYTAIELQRIVVDLNKELQKQSADYQIGVGVGINTGDVVAGYIGSQLRTDYTVIGDSVNLAARLESGAQGGQILIGENTYQHLRELILERGYGQETAEGLQVNPRADVNKEGFTVRYMGEKQVKGKTIMVRYYQIHYQL